MHKGAKCYKFRARQIIKQQPVQWLPVSEHQLAQPFPASYGVSLDAAHPDDVNRYNTRGDYVLPRQGEPVRVTKDTSIHFHEGCGGGSTDIPAGATVHLGSWGNAHCSSTYWYVEA